ncbi:MAG TPA: GNAT family N-acetyltransferase [Gemmatimonadales bacterium]
MSRAPLPVVVRETTRRDFQQIIALCGAVYPDSPPWNEEQLASHLAVFPEGQLVAVAPESGRVVGMASSLIVRWDDYDLDASWRAMTDRGLFTNHDPNGHTLYGAEVMADTTLRRRGIGKALYAARRELTRRLGLLRIRAGARLRGYHRVAHTMSADDYVAALVRGELVDQTLTFQLRQRFQVIGVVQDYLGHDPESLGWAAIIEWVNHTVARRRDYARRNPRFLKRRGAPHRPGATS